MREVDDVDKSRFQFGAEFQNATNFKRDFVSPSQIATGAERLHGESFSLDLHGAASIVALAAGSALIGGLLLLLSSPFTQPEAGQVVAATTIAVAPSGGHTQTAMTGQDQVIFKESFDDADRDVVILKDWSDSGGLGLHAGLDEDAGQTDEGQDSLDFHLASIDPEDKPVSKMAGYARAIAGLFSADKNTPVTSGNVRRTRPTVRLAALTISTYDSLPDVMQYLPGLEEAMLYEPVAPEGDYRTPPPRVVFVLGKQALAMARQMPSTNIMRARARISSSLYMTAQNNGLPNNVLAKLMQTHSYDIDFSRDIREGDLYEALYESDTEHLLFTAITLQGNTQSYYWFEDADGHGGYYDETGQSARKALFTHPLPGARVSSGYGYRQHPVLNVRKMHYGIDYKARRGTPIVAAADGIIEKAGWNGAYGRYIRIRHNGSYKSAYAHMSRLAKGMHPGVRVKQGQVIGYVGSTGRSTGNHLHFEVHKNGDRINPRKVRAATGRKLGGKTLELFQASKRQIDQMRTGAPVLRQVAGSVLL